MPAGGIPLSDHPCHMISFPPWARNAHRSVLAASQSLAAGNIEFSGPAMISGAPAMTPLKSVG